MNSYSEILSYLYARLPMFTRIGKAAYKADLVNTEKMMEALGHPEHQFKSVHIAGTNGKGSTSHMLASILQQAGYKTGLYTSPHIKDFRERIRINGAMIPEVTVIDFVKAHQSFFETIEPSFFEWTVALCFDYFSKQQVDIAIIETGLGGRLDSTNVVLPLLSLITNISYDHTDLLGDTLEKIAAEKAGIIKPRTPVVISQKQESIVEVFNQKAKACNAELTYASDIYIPQQIRQLSNSIVMNIYKNESIYLQDLECALPGNYQQLNIPGVLAAIDALQKAGYNISEEHIRNGLLQVKTTTGLMGRWEVLQEAPLVVADTAHNEDGIKQIVAQLRQQTYEKLYIVFGMVNDKLPEKVLMQMPKEATYLFCRADMPRAMNDEELKTIAETFGLKGKSYGSVANAFIAAKAMARKNDMIYIGGSTFVVAEVM